MPTIFNIIKCIAVTSIAVAIFLSIPCPSLNAQDIENESPEKWIASLADPLPSVRSSAERAILELGDEVIPFVKEGLQNSNLEIHNRCRILLEKLESQRRKRLAKTFLEAEEGDASLEQFPAWLKFRQFVDDRSVLSRKLFLRMCDNIPLVFENYDFKVEQTGPALKQAARLVLFKEKHSASWETLLIAYLFLADGATKSKEAAEGPLFNSVEILEGVNSISNPENSQVVLKSEFRGIVDGAVARWIKACKERQSGSKQQLPEGTIFNLVYQTANPFLIDDLVVNYDELDKAKKFSFLEIVSRATVGKKGADINRCANWLKKALDDDFVMVNSRFTKRPAEKIEVTAKMLAETLLAELLNKDVENNEPIEFETVWGVYPRSGKAISVIKSQNDRQQLSNKLRVRMEQPKDVE